MRSISAEARLVMNTRRNFVNYATMFLSDGTRLDLTPSDFRISGNNFTDDWCDGESFQLGSVIGKTATILLDNTDNRIEYFYNLQTSQPVDWNTNFNEYYIKHGSEYLPVPGTSVPTWTTNTYYTRTSTTYIHGKFSTYDFYMAYFVLYIHLPNATHYLGELVDEVIPIGTFTVTTPASHGATIEITGVDNMYLFDKPFDKCTLDFDNNGRGVDLKTILRRCCEDCGVAIGYSESFNNHDIIVKKKPEGVTYREVVSYIVQIAGCNAKISVSGALTFGWYSMAPFGGDGYDGGTFSTTTIPYSDGDTADGGSFNPWNQDVEIDGGFFTDPIDFHNLTATNGTTISTDDIQFTGVSVSYDVEVDGSNETQSLHYPNTINWDTYALEIEGNPFITQSTASVIAQSIWDVLKDLKFRVFSCSSIQDPTIEAGDCAIVYDVKSNIYNTIITNVTFKTGGMTELSCKAESPVSQNQRYVSPAAKATARAKENMETYNSMVAHFNEIANAALGYYKTEVVDSTSGAITTYYHDKTTLNASTNVIMINASGIFISDDYNTTRSWNSGVDITTATMLMNLIYVHGLTADWIKTGTLTLGGFNNIDGVLNAYANTQIGSGTWSSGNADVNITYANSGSREGTFPVSIYIDNISNVSAFKGKYTLMLTTNKGNSWTTIETKGLVAGENKIASITLAQSTKDTRYYKVRFSQYSGGAGTYRYRVNVNRLVTTIDRTGITTTNGTFEGTIRANTGNIGPWTIMATAIYKGNNAWGNANGMYFGDSGLSIKDKFKVNSDGTVTANGTITAGSGSKFGNWYIGNDAIYRGSETWGSNNTLYFGSNGLSVKDKFKVNSSGELTATGASISGTLSSSNATISGTLTAGANSKIGPWSVLDSCIYKGSSTWGASSGKYFGDDGISITDKFKVSSTGYLTATSGEFSGELVSATGTITDGSGTLGLAGGSLYMTASNPGLFAYGNGGNIYACWGALNCDVKKYDGTRTGDIPTYDVVMAGQNRSDKRLKKNIKDISIDFAKKLIMGIKPKSFRFKKNNPDTLQFGVIAQDIQKVLEEEGIEDKNRLCYVVDEEGYLGVEYRQLIAPIIKVIQSQQEEIDTLKQEVELLKQLVNAK